MSRACENYENFVTVTQIMMELNMVFTCHYCLISPKVLWVKFHFNDYFNVHTYCLLQNLRFLLVHSFSAPSMEKG